MFIYGETLKNIACIISSYRPESHIRVRFQETATFKQVELRLHFNKLKWQHIRVLHSLCPTKLFPGGHRLMALVQGKFDCHFQPFLGVIMGNNTAFVAANRFFGNGQPQTGAAGAALSGIGNPIKWLKQL